MKSNQDKMIPFGQVCDRPSLPDSARSRVRLASEGEHSVKGELRFIIHVEDAPEPVTLFVHRKAQVRELAKACGQETWSVWQRIHGGWKELDLDASVESLNLPPRPLFRLKPMELHSIRAFVCFYDSGPFHECLFCPSFRVSQSSTMQNVIGLLSQKGRIANSPLSQYQTFTIPMVEGAHAIPCGPTRPIIDLAKDGQVWVILGKRKPSEAFRWLAIQTIRGGETMIWKYPVTGKMKVEQLTRIVFPMQNVEDVTFSKEMRTELEPLRSHMMIDGLGLTADDKIVAVTASELNSEAIDDIPFIEVEEKDWNDVYRRRQERASEYSVEITLDQLLFAYLFARILFD
jgi:hypothetical protein